VIFARPPAGGTESLACYAEPEFVIAIMAPYEATIPWCTLSLDGRTVIFDDDATFCTRSDRLHEGKKYSVVFARVEDASALVGNIIYDHAILQVYLHSAYVSDSLEEYLIAAADRLVDCIYFDLQLIELHVVASTLRTKATAQGICASEGLFLIQQLRKDVMEG
jgi:hypothetical protein